MVKVNKILLLEDDVFISELYTRSLRRAGYDVMHVNNGPSALSEAKTNQYDLMLLDIMVPKLTGVDILKALREKEDLVPNMKIIVATNLDQDEKTREMVEKMADGYIIKADVTPKHLIELIKQIEELGEFTQTEE